MMLHQTEQCKPITIGTYKKKLKKKSIRYRYHWAEWLAYATFNWLCHLFHLLTAFNRKSFRHHFVWSTITSGCTIYVLKSFYSTSKANAFFFSDEQKQNAILFLFKIKKTNFDPMICFVLLQKKKKKKLCVCKQSTATSWLEN